MGIQLSSIVKQAFGHYRNNQIRVVGLGDSLAQYGNGMASSICANGGGRYAFVKSLGVGGETSAQVLARLPSALAYSPDLLVIQCGTNDAVGDIATVVANVKSMCDSAKSANAIPFVIGLPPNNLHYAKVAEINAALQSSCYADNTLFYNPWNFINRGDGAFVANSTIGNDGTHPLIKNLIACGPSVVGHLNSVGIYPIPFKSVYSNSGDGGKFTNAVFYVDTNADGLSDGCVAIGTGGTFTRPAATKTFGFAQKCEFTGATSSSGIGMTASGLTIGKNYYASAKVRIVVTSGEFRFTTFSNGGSGNNAIGGPYHPIYTSTDGTIDLSYCEEFSATGVSVQTNFYCVAGTACTFSIEIEQFQIFETPNQ